MKKKIKPLSIITLIIVPFLVMCGDKSADDINYEMLDQIDITTNAYGIVPLPPDLGEMLTTRFTKYTKVVAPNGKPIHIMVQSGVSDLQAVRAREILKYHLTDAPGTQYGSDKTAIANKMGDNRATLIYTDTEANSFGMRKALGKTKLRLQDLYATESPVEGSDGYINNTGGRDASYEEIFHLVHAKAVEEILPDFDQEIINATKAAVKAGQYFYGPPASPHEYIITGFDVYFDLWRHDPQKDGKSFGDEYIYHTREELKEGDHVLYELVEKYWPPFLTYNAYIDPDFEGVFSLTLDDVLEYTFKSQYLVQATLTGNKPSGLLGNKQDNILMGNKGDNTLTGGQGNDFLDGGEGMDVAVFLGEYSDYEIVRENDKIMINDKIEDRDGDDQLINIEIFQFKDMKVEENKLGRTN